MNIHLEDIPPRGDMRNYGWQKLVNAVKRACNVQVTPPLIMSQSMSGTVIGLNTGALPKPNHWTGHNVSTDTSVSGVAGVVNLDTEIGSRGTFTLASNAVTAPLLGLAMFHWSGVFVLSSSGYLTIWLEEDSGSGYAILDPTLRDFAGSTTPDSYSMTWPHEVASANNKYRIGCQCSTSSGTIYATLSKGYGGSALAIVAQ